MSDNVVKVDFNRKQVKEGQENPLDVVPSLSDKTQDIIQAIFAHVGGRTAKHQIDENTTGIFLSEVEESDEEFMARIEEDLLSNDLNDYAIIVTAGSFAELSIRSKYLAGFLVSPSLTIDLDDEKSLLVAAVIVNVYGLGKVLGEYDSSEPDRTWYYNPTTNERYHSIEFGFCTVFIKV